MCDIMTYDHDLPKIKCHPLTYWPVTFVCLLIGHFVVMSLSDILQLSLCCHLHCYPRENINFKYYGMNRAEWIKASRIQWPGVHGQWFSDMGHQIIPYLQCNLLNCQWILKSIALGQIKLGKILENLMDEWMGGWMDWWLEEWMD